MRKKLGGIAALALIAGSLVIAAPAVAADYTFIDTPSDGPVLVDSSTATRTISVNGVGMITSVTITLDFHKIDGSACAAPDSGSAYSDEIGFSLESPAGTTVVLINTYPNTPTYSNWGAAAPRVQVTLDDTAAAAVGAGGAPETGTFTPAQPLSAFAGENPNGIWTLNVTDSVGADPLCYYGASLTVSDARASTATVVTATPNPITAGSETVLTATVTGASPTGQVEFFSGSLSLGTAPLVDGVATLPVTGFEVGTHEISAVYPGDENNAGSGTLEAVVLTVNAAPSSPTPTPPARVETAAA